MQAWRDKEMQKFLCSVGSELKIGGAIIRVKTIHSGRTPGMTYSITGCSDSRFDKDAATRNEGTTFQLMAGGAFIRGHVLEVRVMHVEIGLETTLAVEKTDPPVAVAPGSDVLQLPPGEMPIVVPCP